MAECFVVRICIVVIFILQSIGRVSEVVHELIVGAPQENRSAKLSKLAQQLARLLNSEGIGRFISVSRADHERHFERSRKIW